MRVNVIYDEMTGTYTVEVNGTTLYECLSENEVDCLTLKEISEDYIKYDE